ncbi:Alpha-L-arabinofuranosidase 2 [Linum perenne]
MANRNLPPLLFFILSCLLFTRRCYAHNKTKAVVSVAATLKVDVSGNRRTIPNTMFGVFFEEINHAGAGGLWAELVSNRGFEAGGRVAPSNIAPWNVFGGEKAIYVATELTSCFENNKMALRMEVLCDGVSCPRSGVGIYNPGYWGMNIEQGKSYKLVFYVRSLGPVDLVVSLMGRNRTQTLASQHVTGAFDKWTKMNMMFKAQELDTDASLVFKTYRKAVIWFDQVSLMPLDTYKGHGFRSDLTRMVADLKPAFIRFPGGCFVEGEWLRNAVRWKETVGPWENRPGHFGDEALDGIEFAVGPANSTWGSVRAKMGHPKPFDLRYVAVGNEDCFLPYYRGNYLMFFYAIRKAYPNIKIISNCDYIDPVVNKLDPADYYDFHIYTNASDIFNQRHKFDTVPRKGPKAFVSEYAVWKEDGGSGTLKAALGEAGFLLGLEKNSDHVEMATYAPLLVNKNDRTWIPDSIAFDSSRAYGTPSYWMQTFFSQSNGATLLTVELDPKSSFQMETSAIIRKDASTGNSYLKIKVVNVGSNMVDLKIEVNGLKISKQNATRTEMTFGNVMEENTFDQPLKIKPVRSELKNPSGYMNLKLAPNSLTSFDLDIKDPEHPYSLEELNVISEDAIEVDDNRSYVRVTFTPTVEHCSMATVIGLCLRVKLMRSLPPRFKVDIRVAPGTHATEAAVNKQLNDKERIAAALENPNLVDMVDECLAPSYA